SYDTVLFTHAWQLFPPALMIVTTVLAFHTVGDGLRDAFGVDRGPKLSREQRRGLTLVRRPEAPSRAAATPGETAPLLRIAGLSVEFARRSGDVRVVEDLHLRIDRGKVVGLVGESGSGKTVTSLAVMRLVP